MAREIRPNDLANIRQILELVNLMPNAAELRKHIEWLLGRTREAAILAVFFTNSWDNIKVALQVMKVGVDEMLDQIKLAWSFARTPFQTIWEWIRNWVYPISLRIGRHYLDDDDDDFSYALQAS